MKKWKLFYAWFMLVCALLISVIAITEVFANGETALYETQNLLTLPYEARNIKALGNFWYSFELEVKGRTYRFLLNRFGSTPSVTLLGVDLYEKNDR